MIEDFRFSTIWKEHDADGIERDYLKVYTFSSYQGALDQHRRAARGEWLTTAMLWPEITALVGMTGGRARVIQPAVQLWVDDRPPLTRAQFTALREAAVGKMAERDQSVGEVRMLAFTGSGGTDE